MQILVHLVLIMLVKRLPPAPFGNCVFAEGRKTQRTDNSQLAQDANLQCG